MELAPQLVEKLIFGFGDHRRRTQDSPVLPDVWAYFATPSADEVKRHPLVAPMADYEGKGGKGSKSDEPLELLLTPHFDAGPAALARELRERLDLAKETAAEKTPSGRRSQKKNRKSRNIAYTQSYVAARLYFDEVATVLLPLTPWWRKYVWKGIFRDEDADAREDRDLGVLLQGLDAGALATILEEWGRTQVPESCDRISTQDRTYWERSLLLVPGFERGFPVEDDLLWILRIIGTIQWARGLTKTQAKKLRVLGKKDAKGRERVALLPSNDGVKVDYLPIVKAGLDLLLSDLPVVQSFQPTLWQINRNRPASSAVWDSRRAIKADAAIHLFDIKCNELAWAVLDSGIDARHPAFLLDEDPKKRRRPRKKPEGQSEGEKVETKGAAEKAEAKKEAANEEEAKVEDIAEAKAPWYWRTRVKRTYDFTRLRPLLNQEIVREIFNAEDVRKPDNVEEDLLQQLEPILDLLYGEEVAGKARAKTAGEDWDREGGRLRQQLQELQKRLETGREIDWGMLDPLLEVPHYKDSQDESQEYRYPVPTSSHGTHVAGILAGKWDEKKLAGICPDIWLYDLRVLDPHGPNDEFTVLAALQFVQYLNLQKEILTIQGANLSLSIIHDVSTYACGRTPVCEECERLVATGVVVVAAGGNAGFDEGLAEAGAGAGYRTVSITDPGNAEAVITVGATHRNQPHTYGVSFFSSRGPTGDGRAKPDLVAPGEKVTSTIPGERMKREDGTSMAAPHVSGAAALLMARHQELIGRPQRIKEILCSTATDLGRERHFQGAGMLDVLRALQSV